MNKTHHFHKQVLQKAALFLSGLMIAALPLTAMAEMPEINCSGLSEEESMKFYELSGNASQALEEQDYESALDSAEQAMKMCTTDAYTEYTLARIYQLTDDCANAYFHYERLSNLPSDSEAHQNYPDIFKDIKKQFKAVKNTCGDVVTLEVQCEQPDIQLSVTGLGSGSTIPCPFYGKVKPGAYPIIASKDGYQARKDTVNVEAGKDNKVTIEALKESNSKGYISIRCPKGATKFEIKNSQGKVEEYACQWSGELPADTYQIKLSGAPDEEAVTVVLEKKARIDHVIPAAAKSKCSATPLASTGMSLPGVLFGLLSCLGLAICRRRRGNE